MRTKRLSTAAGARKKQQQGKQRRPKNDGCPPAIATSETADVATKKRRTLSVYAIAAKQQREKKLMYNTDVVFKTQQQLKVRAKYQTDPAFRTDWQSKMRRKYQTDPAFHTYWQSKMRTKYHSDHVLRCYWRSEMKIASSMKYKTDSNFRAKVKQNMKHRAQAARKTKLEHMQSCPNHAVCLFREHIKQGPVCTCIMSQALVSPKLCMF